MLMGGGPGVRIMRFRGVDVRLDLSVILIMALFIFPQAAQFPRSFPNWSVAEVWGAAILIGVLFVGSILVHELSHALVGMWLGAEVTGIRLYIFGGATFFSSKPVSEGRNFFISIVGPLSNLALWGVFDLASNSSLYGTVWYVTCYYLSTINFFLAVFNALPGYPMDGGMALRSGLIHLTKNELLAARVVAVLGCLTGGLIGLWAVQAVLDRDTISVLFRAYIAYWIISGSLAQYRQVNQFRVQTPSKKQPDAPPIVPTGVKVGQVMIAPPFAFPPDVTIEQFLAQTANLDDKAWLPILREGYLNGLVTRQMARKTPKADLATRKLEQVMVLRRNLAVVNVEDDVSIAAQVALSNRGQPLAVLGAGGLFAGLVNGENLRG